MSMLTQAKRSLCTDAISEATIEPVLIVPSYLTKIAYAILLENRCVPRTWHYEGRFGSRTHKIDEHTVGIPLLNSKSKIDVIHDKIQKRNCENNLNQSQDYVKSYTSYNNLDDLLSNTNVVLMFKPSIPSNKIPKIEQFDATINPERMPKDFHRHLQDFLRNDRCVTRSAESQLHQDQPIPFTFSELFCGIGGFSVALEKLGGRCVFACDIYQPSIDIYKKNLDINYLRNKTVAGDIWTVDSKDIPPHDLLVGGFPCQPFSSLGTQPGLKDNKTTSGRGKKEMHPDSCSTNDEGRGQLFTQIVRVLKRVRPKGFLLENVPGIVTTDNGKALEEIVSALQGAGYVVSHQVCSARGMTAQSRKRLFIVGLIDDDSDQKPFEFSFPYVPDLQLRAGDILHHYDELESSEPKTFDDMGVPYAVVANICRRSPLITPSSLFRLSDAQMDQLCHRSKTWKPAKLAWNNTSCDTIDSHYGVTVGKGNSQLVPSCAPYHPRRFTPRECARIQGFPNSFLLGDYSRERHQNSDDYTTFYTFIKEQYYMLGNAVCPPLIAILGGAILNRIKNDSKDWMSEGLWRGIELSLQSVSPVMLESVSKRLIESYRLT